MKHDFMALKTAVEKSIGKTLVATNDVEKVVLSFSKHQITLSAKAIKLMWHYIKGTEKPSEEMLNTLALLLGFQKWSDFQKALHGKNDAELNYEEPLNGDSNNKHKI